MKTVRELLEKILPEASTDSLTLFGIHREYRERVLDALCVGAEIVYNPGAENQSIDMWTQHPNHQHLNAYAIRLKPQPIKRGVSKREIVDKLRQVEISMGCIMWPAAGCEKTKYESKMNLGMSDLADRIESEGIVE